MAPESKLFNPSDATDKGRDLVQQRVVSIGADSAILDEAALLAIGEDIGSRGLLSILRKLRENLSQHAEKFTQAVTHGDLALAKKTAHDIQGMSMQFGAPSLAIVAKAAELDAKNIEDMPTSNLVAAIGAVITALHAFDAKYLKNGID